MIKLVILDFDDTLSLTEEACFYLENDIAKQMGFPPMNREAHKKNWGKPLGEAIIERVPGINSEEFMRRVEDAIPDYVAQGKYDSLTNENLAALNQLKEKGYKLALLTSRSLSELHHLLHETHPLSSKVEAFYHKDNSLYIKPDPRVFDKILADFNVISQEAVYVGDNVSDAIAAKGAGLHFIAVLESGLRTKEDFSEQPVDYFVEKFTDIVSVIQNIK